MGLEPTFPACEWLQTHALVRTATVIGFQITCIQFETFYLIDESNVFKFDNFVNLTT